MSVVTITVLSDGQPVDAGWPLLSADIRHEVNRLPSAVLLYLDGDAAQRKFVISDSRAFEPGREIQIKARYEGQPGREATLFSGLVVRHAIEARAAGSQLRVELRDKAVKLTRPRRSRVFDNLSDSGLIAKLVKDAGLKVGQMASTQPQHKALVQYDCSDWDLLLARAEANGLQVLVADGTVSLLAPQLSAQAALEIRYGIDSVHALEFEADALYQDDGVSARAWAPAQQKALDVQASVPPPPQQGGLRGPKLAQALGFGPRLLVHPVPLVQQELKAWVDSEAQRCALALLRGSASLPGIGQLALGQTALISGMAQCFNGKAWISGLCHRIDHQGWVSDLQFGLSPRAFSAQPGIQPPPAAGLLPAVGGLQIGIVGNGQDPEGEHRVPVMLAGLGEGTPVLWARLAAPDAGAKRGWCFRPEPGDEVVLGFFNQDPRQPVILGALFGSHAPPPAALHDSSDHNTLRGIVSRAGLILGLVDDDKPRLYLKTPGGSQLVFDDDPQTIELTDRHKNKLTLDQNGITLFTPKDLKLQASGAVEIKGRTVDLQ